MKHGIDCQAGDGLDASLVGNILAVGVDGVAGDMQAVGYLLAAATLRHKQQYLGLAVAEFVILFDYVAFGLATFAQALCHMATLFSDV